MAVVEISYTVIRSLTSLWLPLLTGNCEFIETSRSRYLNNRPLFLKRMICSPMNY